MDKIIKKEQLKDAFPYLNHITVAGPTQEEHDSNVKAFLELVQRRHLTIKHSKSVLSALYITVLGYVVEHGCIKPDPDRLHPLQNFPPLHLYVHSAEPRACLPTTQNRYRIFPIRLQLGLSQRFPSQSITVSSFQHFQETIVTSLVKPN